MSKDLVLITAYSRPDYLRLVLEYLSRAEGIENKDIQLCVDRGRSLIREFYDVLNDFPHLKIHSEFRDEHDFYGNSYNTLMAYAHGYLSDSNYVYLIEEDVLVAPDFFKWHETVQEQELVQNHTNLMCSVAYRCSRNPNRHRAYNNDPQAYLVSGQDYASIGVCWKRENLASVIEHARPEYYENPITYLDKHFPNNRFSNCFTEQDGLIMRILDSQKGKVAWPFVPRAYHIGVNSYNRPNGPKLSYTQLKETIHNMEKIKQADKDFGDIEVVPEQMTPKWDKLYCVQRFE